jgi:hypothetical protein
VTKNSDQHQSFSRLHCAMLISKEVARWEISADMPMDKTTFEKCKYNSNVND